MKRYRVTGTMTISVYVTVTAKSKAEARRLANDAATLTLCHQCADGDPDVWSTSGELDGAADIDHIEELP